MTSIQGSNPLDRLASYFKPCTKEFSQEEYYNVEDAFTELQERQPKNPLNNLDIFFQPLTKKFEESNDEIWTSHNPFVEKIEIESSLGIKSSRSNKLLTKSSSQKRRRIDSFDDEYKPLPLLSMTTTSSDTSSSESSDEEGENDTFSSSRICCDNDLTSELQFDDNIIENLKTLSLVSDNLTSRKIAKPKSKKQDAAPDEDPKKPTTEKRNEKSRLEVAQPENLEGEEKSKEVLRTIPTKIEEGKGYQKISKINGMPEAPRAGFIGGQEFKYLDILDNKAFKVRHQKVITKKIREANLSDGLSSLLSSGFKPTNMLG
ncbi:hypothetical protein RclHR1_00440039 [Rhizophagus clarus]|uniref:Uncharacterized protein n=1 Tax=Rhizophagus clarus TaxID=94130 RepID=A0A2Z6RM32_9GLOM|nr:hypothetical protein RclHR1_00440039 [Rhizophagus clarus]GES93479.1 hypothetical protein GLOIN_2v542929 [Rhizophagus clarus]